ncbi:hypothetical protein Plhal703r1_c13g0066671 [Plasmopara halstedii]
MKIRLIRNCRSISMWTIYKSIVYTQLNRQLASCLKIFTPKANPSCLNMLLLKILCRAGYRRWIVHAQFISIFISIITSIIVVSYGQNPTNEKGCLAADILRFVCYFAGVFMALSAL